MKSSLLRRRICEIEMTGKLGSLCARYPWRTIFVWIVLTVVGLALVDQYFPTATTTVLSLGGQYESTRAATLLEERLRGPEKLGEIVVIHSYGPTVDDAEFRARVDAVHAEIVGLGSDVISGGLADTPISHYYQVVTLQQALGAAQELGISPPFSSDDVDRIAARIGITDWAYMDFLRVILGPAGTSGEPAALLTNPEQLEQLLGLLVSPTGNTVLLHYTLAGDSKRAIANVPQLIEIVEHANEVAEFDVLIGGSASTAYETNELGTEDIEKGERFGVPVALIVLLLLFGAVVATLLPLGLAIISIVVAMAVAAVIGQQAQLFFMVSAMIIMIGLAVGIDYSLVIVSRFKEELRRGTPTYDAVVKTSQTANRTVLFSGATVVLALLGLFIVPASFYQSTALGAILVVISALAATLTLLPAVLVLLGPRVNRLSLGSRLQHFSLDSTTSDASGFWDTMTRIVTRFPWLSIVVTVVPMLVLAWFYLDIRTGLNDVNSFPDKAQTKQAFLTFEREFSFGAVNPAGYLSPAEIVIEGDVADPEVVQAITDLQEALAADPAFPVPPNPLVVNATGDLGLLTLPYPGKPASPEAAAELQRLRSEHIATAFAGVPAQVSVGGVTAEVADFGSIVSFYTPIVFAFVLGSSFIILMIVFRSIVVPLKAILMNLLAVGATYGLLVLVFQKGVGTELLGFQRAEVIDAWLPLFLFTVLFGLSMDYHVFLLSRIRERFDETGDNTSAVAFGLRSTGGLITGAALIMVVVFGAFAAGDMLINQQMGFGLAVAVLLDATIIRSILVPASMEVLGARNWYLPKFLGWLPHLQVEQERAE